MTLAEVGVVVVPGSFALIMYLYLLNERRKLIAAREKRQHPAE